MKISRNTLFLFDFWFVIGFIIFYLVLLIMPESRASFLLARFIFYLFVGFSFAKSIVGGILVLRAFNKNELNITKNVFFFLLHLFYIMALIYTVYTYRFRLSDPDIDYIIIIHGLNIHTYRLYQLAIINLFVNMIGMPSWLFYYTFSKNTIKNYMKIILNILSAILTLFINWLIIFGLTVD
jgi:hypothetical protein